MNTISQHMLIETIKGEIGTLLINKSAPTVERAFEIAWRNLVRCIPADWDLEQKKEEILSGLTPKLRKRLANERAQAAKEAADSARFRAAYSAAQPPPRARFIITPEMRREATHLAHQDPPGSQQPDDD